jgi:signal transduction histidine kinase
MKQRKANLSGFLSGTQTLTIISLITAIIAILYSLATYNTENKAKGKSQEEAIRYSKELEQSVSQLKDSNVELIELRSIEKFAATGRIARTMAHEVRNPLTNISLAAEQLNEMGDNNSEAKLLLDMISRNSVRINQLVADLLNATRFVQLDIQKVSVNDVLDQTLEMAKDRIDLNSVTVEKAYSQQPLVVAIDVEKIKLAFLNIIVNAIEAMEKGKGALRLKTRRDGGKCIIEIRDNGIGMNDDTLSKLFEPYFTGKQKGNGLGLTNTQNIILNHKGNIKVISHPGEGTTFRITLELAGEHDGQEA